MQFDSNAANIGIHIQSLEPLFTGVVKIKNKRKFNNMLQILIDIMEIQI